MRLRAVRDGSHGKSVETSIKEWRKSAGAYSWVLQAYRTDDFNVDVIR